VVDPADLVLDRVLDGHDHVARIVEQGAVHDPEHDLLAVRGRHDRDPQVERVAVEADRDAAVLGARRSTMSRLPMIFSRLSTPSCICFGICATGRVTPSIRARTIMSSSWGSKWMSEAPSSIACARPLVSSLAGQT
jgi:hypothetical protein